MRATHRHAPARRLLVAAAALLACGLATPHVASAAAAAPPGGIEVMVVTAQKREQNLQVVPVAISAFDADFIEDAAIDDAFELQFFAPSLTVRHNQSGAQSNFNIRGVGTDGNSLSLESSVGIYVDGVFRSRQSSALHDLVDLERVEVLKGPQGTLFGKNTPSGAVQFLTAPADPKGFSAWLSGAAGNEDYRTVSGAINVPFAGNRAAVRLTGTLSERDGYVQNVTSGDDLNDRDRFALRGQIAWDLTDTLSARLIADVAEIDEACCAASNFLDGPGDTTAAFLAAGGVLVPLPTGPANASYRLPLELVAGGPGSVVLASRFEDREVAVNREPGAKVEDSGASLQLAWDVRGHVVTSITALREYDARNATDVDFTALDIFTGGDDSEQRTFTQELRIASTGAGPLQYVAGAYWFDQELENVTTLRTGASTNAYLTGGATLGQLDALGFFAPSIPAGAICAGLVNPALVPLCPLPAFPAGHGSDNLSEQEQRSWALFAQVDFEVSQDWLLTAGARYTDERKDMDARFLETLATPVFAALVPLSPVIPDATDTRPPSATPGAANLGAIDFDQDNVSYTIKLSWFPSEALMAYASFGTGYKSGGTNIDRIDPLAGARLTFDPEESFSWEAGLKGEFLDRRLRVNASVYLTDFDDFQANTFVGTGFVLQNAGEIRSTGGELEVLAAPVDWLTLTGGLSVVDAEYREFRGGPCIITPLTASPDRNQPLFPDQCDRSGDTVPGTPPWSLFGSARVTRAVTAGVLGYAQLDVNARDDTEAGNDNDPNKIADDLVLVNARIGATFGDDKVDVSLWAKNLFDESFHVGAFNSVIREGSLTGYHDEPRTYGLTVRVAW
jgi:outer membrane receptor protein involved in Fe transport